jgi:hypothetical protein
VECRDRDRIAAYAIDEGPSLGCPMFGGTPNVGSSYPVVDRLDLCSNSSVKRSNTLQLTIDNHYIP